VLFDTKCCYIKAALNVRQRRIRGLIGHAIMTNVAFCKSIYSFSIHPMSVIGQNLAPFHPDRAFAKVATVRRSVSRRRAKRAMINCVDPTKLLDFERFAHV
jgi:hypothetical protein